MKNKLPLTHSDYYHRNGVTLREARNLCIILGLKPSRHIYMAAQMLILNK